jgi:hypothetical protein
VGYKMKVYKAINAVQSELVKVGIAKDSHNSQGAGYKFRGIDAVYNVLSGIMANNGLCIIPRMLNRTCEERTSKSGSALFYVTVEAEFDIVSSEDGSKHTAKTFGEAMDSGDKATNKAMSAAYKYMAFQTFAIPTQGDNDADAFTHEVSSTSSQRMADHLVAIQDAKNSDELKKAYTEAYKACGTDANWQKKIIAAKDEKKASLA